MNKKKMPKEELEQLSYADITHYLLQQKKKPRTTGELFNEIIKLLQLPDSTFEEQIGDYYTALTTDKRFIILNNGKWDLRSNHTSDNFLMTIEEEDEDEEIELDEAEEEAEEDEDEEFDDFKEEDEDLVDEDEDLEDLAIVEDDYEG